MPAWTIERMGPAAWERVRSVRFRALGDAPDAFSTTLADAQARAPASWRERLADPGSATFVASLEGRDVGMVAGSRYGEADADAGLFSMWVAAEARGGGVGAALVDAVVQWARLRGCRRVLLDVADTNRAAIGLYARCGFVPTGVTSAMPPPREHIREHQRALRL